MTKLIYVHIKHAHFVSREYNRIRLRMRGEAGVLLCKVEETGESKII